jgi:hypothetical protein
MVKRNVKYAIIRATKIFNQKAGFFICASTIIKFKVSGNANYSLPVYPIFFSVNANLTPA